MEGVKRETAVTEIAQGATSQTEETQAAAENVAAIGNMIEDTNDVVNELPDFTKKQIPRRNFLFFS